MALNPPQAADGVPLARVTTYHVRSAAAAASAVNDAEQGESVVVHEVFAYCARPVHFGLEVNLGYPGCMNFYGYGACHLSAQRAVLAWEPPLPTGFRALEIPLWYVRNEHKRRSGFFTAVDTVMATVDPFLGSVYFRSQQSSKLRIACTSADGTDAEEFMRAWDRALAMAREAGPQHPPPPPPPSSSFMSMPMAMGYGHAAGELAGDRGSGDSDDYGMRMAGVPGQASPYLLPQGLPPRAVAAEQHARTERMYWERAPGGALPAHRSPDAVRGADVAAPPTRVAYYNPECPLGEVYIPSRSGSSSGSSDGRTTTMTTTTHWR